MTDEPAAPVEGVLDTDGDGLCGHQPRKLADDAGEQNDSSPDGQSVGRGVRNC
jgi:hypothetical protein